MKFFVNLITTSRFIYTLILPILQTKVSSNAFILNLVIVFLTDTIDGFLARKFKVQTLYGSIMDTVADKTLSVILLIILVRYYNILIIVLTCEIMIALINVIAFSLTKKTKSCMIGKIKTWLLAISIILGYMTWFKIVDYNIVLVSTLITIVFQVVTFSYYVYYLNHQKELQNPKYKIKNIKDIKYILFNTEYYISII